VGGGVGYEDFSYEGSEGCGGHFGGDFELLVIELEEQKF
jgi:hypothetical protein